MKFLSLEPLQICLKVDMEHEHEIDVLLTIKHFLHYFNEMQLIYK